MAQEISLEDTLGIPVKPGDVLAGKYRFERVVGTGGMGVVLEAWHLQFDERVALKLLNRKAAANKESVARFEREAKAAFKIKSEHVARVIDVGQLEGGRPFMVMEYLEGIDLGDVIGKRGALPIEEATLYVLQACEAVAQAHAHGIVHRDLKPENLFLTSRADGSPCIKVLDFGLSKLDAGTSGQRERALTAVAQAMGTPQYMSPEQWMSSRDVGPGTDIWALGVILFELVTGAQPFWRDHVAQLCTLVLNGKPPPMLQYRRDVPPELERVVLRCLEKEPGRRYANVAELAMELYEYCPGQGRVHAKRIAGVFKRAGVETLDQLPPSTRTPELREWMDARTTTDERIDTPPIGTMHAPDPSFDGTKTIPVTDPDEQDDPPTAQRSVAQSAADESGRYVLPADASGRFSVPQAEATGRHSAPGPTAPIAAPSSAATPRSARTETAPAIRRGRMLALVVIGVGVAAISAAAMVLVLSASAPAPVPEKPAPVPADSRAGSAASTVTAASSSAAPPPASAAASAPSATTPRRGAREKDKETAAPSAPVIGSARRSPPQTSIFDRP